MSFLSSSAASEKIGRCPPFTGACPECSRVRPCLAGLTLLQLCFMKTKREVFRTFLSVVKVEFSPCQFAHLDRLAKFLD